MGDSRRTFNDTDWDGYLFDRVQLLGLQNWIDNQLRGRDLNDFDPGVAHGAVISESGIPAMTVDVTLGGTIQANGALGVIPTVADMVVAAADPTNPRIDLVVAQVTEATDVPLVNALTSAVFDSEIVETGAYSVVTGVAAASPVAPAKPAGSVIVGSILVPAAATQILDADISLEIVYRGGDREAASPRPDTVASRVIMPSILGASERTLEQWADPFTAMIEIVKAGPPIGFTTTDDAASDVIDVDPGTTFSEDGDSSITDAVGEQRDFDVVFSIAGPGGRASGATKAAETWYSFHIIWKDDGTYAYGWDTAANYQTAAGLRSDAGSGWDHSRRLRWYKTNSGSVLYKSDQDPMFPHIFNWTGNSVDGEVGGLDIPSTNAFNVTIGAPPLTYADLLVGIHPQGWIGSGGRFLVSPLDTADRDPATNHRSLLFESALATASFMQAQIGVKTDLNSQVRFRSNKVGAPTSELQYKHITRGWQDYRLPAG
jgi:hypothetical protein